MAGKLFFRYGAMGCGKTAQLLQTAFNFEERGKTVVLCKPDKDHKGGTKLVTRLGFERETDFVFTKHCNLCRHLRNKYLGRDCVFVDEAQFIAPEQADQLLRFAVEEDVLVFCYGLRLNFKGTDSGFEGATRLLQIANELTEIKTTCECGNKAMFNARFVDGEMVAEGPNILIDGTAGVEYKALCAECFLKNFNVQYCPRCGQPMKNCGKH